MSEESKIKTSCNKLLLKVSKFSVINVSILRNVSTSKPRIFLYFSQHLKLQTDAISRIGEIKIFFDFLIADNQVTVAYLENDI